MADGTISAGVHKARNAERSISVRGNYERDIITRVMVNSSSLNTIN